MPKMRTEILEKIYTERMPKEEYDKLDHQNQARLYKNAYHRLYLQKNPDKKLKFNKAYYEANKIRLLENQRRWRAKNREKNLANMREYQRKLRRAAGMREMPRSQHAIVCQCGGRYTTHNSKKHFQTKKHQAFMSKAKE